MCMRGGREGGSQGSRGGKGGPVREPGRAAGVRGSSASLLFTVEF